VVRVSNEEKVSELAEELFEPIKYGGDEVWEALKAAVRAGMHAEREACLHIAMARYGRWTKLADGSRHLDERLRQDACAREAEDIADAIAKRDKP
jgi:hypothetical protein